MATADAHVHLFADGFAGTYGPLLADELAVYEELRTQFGIARALVVGYEGDERYAGNNAHILRLARDRPWIAPVPYLRSETPPTVGALRELRSQGAVGYALYVSDATDVGHVIDWPFAALEELRAQKAIVSLNATPSATGAIGPLVDTLPDCTFLFSHLGLPGRFGGPPSRAEIEARVGPLLSLSSRPNALVKLSGLYAITDPPHAFPHRDARAVLDAVLAAFGPARVCWGSDFAPALDFVSFGQLTDTSLLEGLSDAEIAGVMGANLDLLLLSARGKE